MSSPAPEVALPDVSASPAPAPVADVLPVIAGLPAVPVPVALPVAPPTVVREILAPPAEVDTHMAELCAARPVFCQVDSSGRYIGS